MSVSLLKFEGSPKSVTPQVSHAYGHAIDSVMASRGIS